MPASVDSYMYCASLIWWGGIAYIVLYQGGKVFSLIKLSCMEFNRGNSPGWNATSLTEHNTVV